MSVTNQTDKIYGTGDGVTTVFSFPFKIFDSTQFFAYLINIATGVVSSPLILNTDYTITINPTTDGGTITFTVAPAVGYNWFLKRIVPYTQSAVIPTEGPLPGLQISNQLDLLTMMVIQDQEAVSRCLQLPVTYIGSLPVFIPGGLPNAAIGWDPTGQFLTNLQVTAVGPIAVPIANNNLQTIQNNILAQLIQAGLVSGAALTSLANIPAGAGVIPSANLPAVVPVSGLLGAGVTKTITTVYLAATDLFVTVYQTTTSGVTYSNIISDGNSNPSAVIGGAYDNDNGQKVFAVAWVAKGNYYKGTTTGSVASSGMTVYPIGS